MVAEASPPEPRRSASPRARLGLRFGSELGGGFSFGFVLYGLWYFLAFKRQPKATSAFATI